MRSTRAYLVSLDDTLIEVAHVDSKRFVLLKQLVSESLLTTGCLTKCFTVTIEVNIIEQMIESLLKIRKELPLDIPSYDERCWRKEDIFNMMHFKNEDLELCTTGFDNQIIFLINIYDYIVKNGTQLYLLFFNNAREFTSWKQRKL